VRSQAAALEERGADRVVLYAAARNAGARRLFRTLRFRPTMVEMTRERTAPTPRRVARVAARRKRA
jgi:ribosomal protein S18 acetylase RimI-like enzyme